MARVSLYRRRRQDDTFHPTVASDPAEFCAHGQGRHMSPFPVEGDSDGDLIGSSLTAHLIDGGVVPSVPFA